MVDDWRRWHPMAMAGTGAMMTIVAMMTMMAVVGNYGNNGKYNNNPYDGGNKDSDGYGTQTMITDRKAIIMMVALSVITTLIVIVLMAL